MVQQQQSQIASRLQHKKRFAEIYHYFRQDLDKLDKSKHPEYFTPYLNLEPRLAVYIKKLQRKYPDYDP
ncbi:MAG: hypothetical protein NY202_04610 [Mollicutes bacterium UO1]